MNRWQYYPELLLPEECERLHSGLARNYSSIIGHSTKSYEDLSGASGIRDEQAVLVDLIALLCSRVEELNGVDTSNWTAVVNQWSGTRLKGELQMKPHRDRVADTVAVASLHGEGLFTIEKSSFGVWPGDVVIMHNRGLFPPKHGVVITSEHRMSVALWNSGS